jgi:TolB-like protein/Flp pilus assembly protein TadD
MADFLQRLKQRKLVQWALAYVAAAFALVQVVDVVAQRFGWPDRLEKLIILALAVGFFVVLVIAWYHGDKGRQRVSGAELLLIALVLAVGGGLLWRFARAPSNAVAVSVSALSQAIPIPAKSIAVLPFVNLSGDPKEEYFSDGITEEILNALTQVPGLKVAGRTSAFQFNSKTGDLRKVGETLGVATVLEGSVQRSGDQVRITAQLVDAHNGYQLWSEKYDRKLTSVFAVEDEISKAIADKLQVTLGNDQQESLVRQGTTDPHAHELYFKGLAQFAARGPSLVTAGQFFEQAVTIDPNYAAAWAGLAQTCAELPWYGLADWRSSLAKSESAATRALALDPKLGEAHTALANVLRDRLDYAGAAKEYKQALDLDPGSSEAHNQYAQLLGAIGQLDAAIKQERIAVSLDPLAPVPRYLLGRLLVSEHRYDKAIAEQKQVVAQTPAYIDARLELAYAYMYASKYADAEKAARSAAVQAGDDPGVIAALVRGVADRSQRSKALSMVATVHTGRIELKGLTDAFWYSQLGAHDKAVAGVEHWAETTQSGELFAGIAKLWMPAFDPIRNDPRFEAVLKKMGLPYQPVGTTDAE